MRFMLAALVTIATAGAASAQSLAPSDPGNVVARCDEVYATTDAANALVLVPSGKGDALRGMLLLDNVSHGNEHSGNLVSDMRLKGHVPPSTARAWD